MRRAVVAISIIAAMHLALLTGAFIVCWHDLAEASAVSALPSVVHEVFCVAALALGFTVDLLSDALFPLTDALFHSDPNIFLVAVLNSLLWGVAIYASFRFVAARRLQKP